MTETLILDESAVSEIEALRQRNSGPAFGYTHELCVAIDALCATVKQMRTLLDRVPLAQSALNQLDELRAANRRAADELEQLRAENERLKTQRDEATNESFATPSENQERLRRISQRLTQNQALIPTRDEIDFLLSLLASRADRFVVHEAGKQS